MAEKKKVVLIGTNGIPANYGGIETLAEYLARDLNEDFELYCYCSKGQKEKTKGLVSYRNTKLIYLPMTANGGQSIIYDGWSILQSLRKFDVLLILGCSCPPAMFFKIFTKKHIVLNAIGGKETEKVRGIKMFGKIEVAIKKWMEGLQAKYADYVIIDNAANVKDFENKHHVKALLAEYGGDHAIAEPIIPEMTEKYPFLNGEYDVTVSRAQEDMNIHMVIDAYKQVPNRKVVIVSNWQKSEYGQKLYAENAGKYSNIILQNAIYNQKELNIVRSNATLYLHTHSMCGTAPSLVEAMSLNLPVICFKVPTNLETTEHKSICFESVPELVCILCDLDEVRLQHLKNDLHEIALRRYNWKRISGIYKDCINKCIDKSNNK
ncbi:glycosyltransferase [Bacteroides graminisolvens]|uniref:glycosyltransferase n=1 Tax=Bacteroides graminisolvens TaxID=477666 RepID=UPI0023F403DF|nr:glycosyltransferase [Bacteroides graminisolvens]